MSHVSHSEVEAYLSCKRKHFYNYGRKLQKRTSGEALIYGGIGHRVLEAFYSYIAGHDTLREQFRAFDKAKEAALEELAEMRREGFEEGEKEQNLNRLLELYFENEPFVRNGWLIEDVEKEYNLSVGEFDFMFIMDLVVVDPKGKRAIVDHKFSGRFIDSEDTVLKPQLTKYVGAMRANGIRVDYALYNQLKRTKIVGTKSKAFPEGAGPTVAQALATAKLVPNDQQVMNTFAEQIGVSEEILAVKEKPLEEWGLTAWRTMLAGVCQFCDYKLLCEGELTGANTKLLERAEYEPKKSREKVLDTPVEDE